MRLYQRIIAGGLVVAGLAGLLGCERDNTPKPRKFAETNSAALADGDLAIGDLTGDGLADIVKLDQTGVYVIKNLGNGNFSEPYKIADTQSAAGASESVAIGDLDGNGLPDIAKLDQTGTYILRNMGNGQFEYLKK